ncbi:hypothetical protein BG004_004154 [Podila humilis]|nr:hypothetical protein BG004_004154 [Podila humilis]
MPATMYSDRRKSLSIHIATDHVGPHGMPLVYGSTPERVGSLKGTVRFSCNYDCKGKDITIIYEAVAEGRWEALKNKRIVRHQTREIMGHQIWHLPLVHTRPGGTIIASGEYSKEFEVLLVRPSETTAKLLSYHQEATSETNRSSFHSVDSPPLTLPTLIPPSTLRQGITVPAMMPSTSHSPQASIRYTVRAVLQRPFPSITNVEASQEVWILNSSMPEPAAHPLHQDNILSAKNGGILPLLAPTLTRSAFTANTISRSTCQPRPEQQQEQPPQRLHRPRFQDHTNKDHSEDTLRPKHEYTGDTPSAAASLLALPGKAIKSVFSVFLPTKHSTMEVSLECDTRSKNYDTTIKTPAIPYCLSLPVPALAPTPPSRLIDTVAPTVIAPQSAPCHKATAFTQRICAISTLHSTDKHFDSEDEDEDGEALNPGNADKVEYTGVWEPFDVPYSFSISSEKVSLGQRIPLTIQFGPRGQEHVRPRKRKLKKHIANSFSRSPLSSVEDAHRKCGGEVERGSEGEDKDSRRRGSAWQTCDTVVNHIRPVAPQPGTRFVVKKGILKLVEHTLLREVSVAPAPRRLVAGAWSSTQTEDPLHVAQRNNNRNSHKKNDHNTSITTNSQDCKKSIYIQQGIEVTTSHSNIHTKFRKNVQSANHGRGLPTPMGSGGGADGLASKRHSLDHSPSGQAQLMNTPRMISTIESKFKTEVMTMSLTPTFQLQERKRHRQLLALDQQHKNKGPENEREADSSSGNKSSSEEKSAKWARQQRDDVNDHDDSWKSTVWIQIPGPSEMATGTETKGIVKTHSIQIVLLCGQEPLVSTGGVAAPIEVQSSTTHPSSTSVVSLATSGNREFRLERKPKFERDEYEAQHAGLISTTGGNPHNRPQRPGVMVISPNGKVRSYVSRGLEVLQEGNPNTSTSSSMGSIRAPSAGHLGVLTIKAQGRSISKAVTVAEILKRRLEGSLHQFTEIGQTTEQEIWDPNEDKPNLDPLVVSRHRPTIRIRLSTQLPGEDVASGAASGASLGMASDFGDDDQTEAEDDDDSDQGEQWPGAVLDRDAAARKFVGYQAPTGNDIYLQKE